jgi:hypothetical protein
MEIRDDVAHVLIRQGLVMPDLFPIRMTKIWTTRDDYGPQTLITYQGQIAYIGDLLLPLLMAGRAAHLKDILSLFDIAYSG